MKALPSVRDLPVKQKTVLLRTNYDVPLKSQKSTLRPSSGLTVSEVEPSKVKSQNLEVADGTRIDESLPTINYLLKQQAKVVILSHLGRPEGKVNPDLSLKPIADYLSKVLNKEVFFFTLREALGLIERYGNPGGLILLENLRFYPEEEKNDLVFAKKLASLADFFINDAFACSHRKHASIVGIPQFLPPAFGLDFLKEVEILDKIKNNPRRPVVVILGGVKKDKIDLAHKLVNWADNILIGGKIIEDKEAQKILNHHNVVGALIKDKHDITMETIQNFRKIINKAGTIVWAGPMGQYEDKQWEMGTKEIAQTIVESGAYTVVGGGDTEAALTKFGLVQKINYISSGGGAMFEFLAQGTLPGIEAIVKKK